MAEGSGGGSKGPSNPFVKAVRTMLLLMLVLYIAQIILNPPERRPVVACTPLYQFGHFVWLGAYRILAPTDLDTHLRISSNLLEFQKSCVSTLTETEALNLWGWHL